MFVKAFLLLLFIFPASCFAFEEDFDWVVADSAHLFSIEPCLLKALLMQEGGSEGLFQRHANGSVDLGIAQINQGGEWHKFLSKELGISDKSLADNGLLSIISAAFILSTEIKRSNGDLILGVAAYHAGFGNRLSQRGLNYASQVIDRFGVLVNKGNCPVSYGDTDLPVLLLGDRK